MVGASQLALINPIPRAESAGAMAAMEELYRAHGARLKSIAYHIVGNRQDAEDAVQETFLKLHRALPGFQGQSSIGTWLCRIVMNVCYDIARQRRRQSDAPPEAAGAPPNPQMVLRVALRDALARIHPKHRMVFLLFEAEGLRHSEIAAILEIPEGTSKAWLFEAKKELKRLLTEARQ